METSKRPDREPSPSAAWPVLVRPRAEGGREHLAFHGAVLAGLREAAESGDFGNWPVIQAEAMADGNASAVYRLVGADGESRVLKAATSAAVVDAEAAFLSRWRGLGVRTPEVYWRGALPGGDPVPYLLMEFVAGESLLSLMGRGGVDAAEASRDLGRILGLMHGAKGFGFGTAGHGNLRIEGGEAVGSFPNLREQAEAEWLGGALEAALATGLVTHADIPRIRESVEALSAHAEEVGPSLAHTDFRAGNVLYDRARAVPYAVIDPYPSVTHPYLCLAYSLILDHIHSGRPAVDLLTGYGEVRALDRSALREALILRSVLMSGFGKDPESRYGRNLRRLFSELLAGSSAY